MANTADGVEEAAGHVGSILSIRVARVIQRIRESQWFLPFVGIVIGVALSVVIAENSDVLTQTFPGTAWRVTATEARDFLLVFVGIEITVLSIVMALTMVTVQNAANQFSPRLLRVYLRDWVQQAVLTVIAGSTAYFITAATLIGVPGKLSAAPQPVIGFAVFLIPLSGIALVVQINHTLQMIRIEVITHKVAHLTTQTFNSLLVTWRENRIRVADKIKVEPWAVPVEAERFGYVVRVQFGVLSDVATNHNYLIRIDTGIGEPVSTGTPIGWVQAEGPDVEVPNSVLETIRDAVGIDNWRDPTYDVALGIRQLVDVAIKALSPSVNDPRTAVQVVDHLREILVQLARHELGENTIYAEDGRVLVQFHSPSFFDYMLLATSQISWYGRQESSVMMRLVQLCGYVGYAAVRADDKAAVRENLNGIVHEAEQSLKDPFWLEVLRVVSAKSYELIDGRPTPESHTPADL